jgi:hypothetical protein
MHATLRRYEDVDRERTDETDEHVAQKRAQRELTASVGTPLARQEKKGRRRLFGGRRETRTAIS